ncbi:hypothetical protein CRYUN_Cryun28dG0030700 [Craigia yunnanensis]
MGEITPCQSRYGRENKLETRQAEELATILAIGTTNLPQHLHQPITYCIRPKLSSTRADIYINLTVIFVTGEKSAVKKRYMYLTEAIFKENPNLSIYKAPSFDARQNILVTEVPELGMEAAFKVIKKWGQTTHIKDHTPYILYIVGSTCLVPTTSLLSSSLA